MSVAEVTPPALVISAVDGLVDKTKVGGCKFECSVDWSYKTVCVSKN